MAKKIQENQIWLLLLFGIAMGYGGWHFTDSLIVATIAAIVGYFLVMLIMAAPWPAIFLLLSTSGLGIVFGAVELGYRGVKSLGIATGVGFILGIAMLIVLRVIHGTTPEEQVQQESGENPQEGMTVTTSIVGRSLIDAALNGSSADAFFNFLNPDEEERENLKAVVWNSAGVHTTRQREQIEAARAQAAQQSSTKPRRRRWWIFEKIGKRGIRHS